ncbi:MAG: hypothetical protein K6G29_12315 [Clostridiales bacterium]|nr:hypothetical protein [Clostridiales bacterium]
MNDYNYSPEDRAAYPITCAARDALCGIAERYIGEYETALRAAPKEKKLEKRALSIQLNMAKLARTFICFNYNRVPMREQSLVRRNILRRFGIPEPDAPAYAALTEDEKSAWVQFAGSTAFLHQAFIDQHLDKLRAGIEAANADQVFESRIVLGTLYTVLREWLAWWRKKGTYPFEQWAYEDEPWLDGEDEGSDDGE